MTQKVWFITGCSTGFGRALAQVATAKGDKVAGTLRKKEQFEAFEALSPGNIKAILMDVTNPDQVKAGVQEVLDTFGRIDVLVNNAGYGSMGPIEEVSDAEVRRQFDVNVFGALDVTRQVLPHMRKQRSGHIINITSIAGIQGFPGVGIYNGSKFALEGIGEALAAEVKHLGIKVTNVEPGPFRTEWAGSSATFTKPAIEDYAEGAGVNIHAIESRSGKQVGDPVKGAVAMYQLTTLDEPPVHLPLGGPAYNRVRSKTEWYNQEVDAFEYLGKPTDYNEEELKSLDS